MKERGFRPEEEEEEAARALRAGLARSSLPPSSPCWPPMLSSASVVWRLLAPVAADDVKLAVRLDDASPPPLLRPLLLAFPPLLAAEALPLFEAAAVVVALSALLTAS